MKPHILTRERLEAIERSIARNGGTVTVRHLMRNHGLKRRVIDVAIEGGFLTLESHQGPRGRPRQVLKKVSKSNPTKSPPGHSTLDTLIRFRHWNFAFNYVMGEIEAEQLCFKRRAWVAYQKTYPSAHSQPGARASSSRLLRSSKIQAAIAWTFAKYCDRIQNYGKEPTTESEIWDILFERKSFRTRWAPWHIRWRYDQNNDS